MKRISIALLLLIGMTSLSYSKTEDGTSNVVPISLYGSTGSAIIPIKVDADGSVYTNGQWTTSGTSIYYNSGNVGIGTSVPTNKLQVDGSVYFINMGNVGIGSTNPGSRLSVVGTDTANTTRAVNVMDSTNASLLAVTNAGNVGVGSTLPLAKLVVGPGNPSTPNIPANSAYIAGALEVDGSVYVDTSIYLTSPATGGSGLWISQPDGGCSLCGVDNAGTTWSCTNQTCPPGM